MTSILSKFKYDSEVSAFMDEQDIKNQPVEVLAEMVEKLLNYRKTMLQNYQKRSAKIYERRKDDPEFKAKRREITRNYRARLKEQK